MNNLIDNRQIRVFISSTFQDMQDERDYLMKHTFPMLRKKAAGRDVTLTELDLRWGITPEESESGKVVEICLREIENSIPFFVGIIGDRYGWVPAENDLTENTKERFPQVKDYLERRLSVTEMEMQFGVLARKETGLHAYFYIKEETASAETDNPEMLERLKEEVKKSQYPSSTYTSLEDLGSQVEKAFSALLDKIFPEGNISELEEKRIGQRSFMHRLCQNYIRDEHNFSYLDDWFADRSRQCLVVTGASGLGKSALIANWLRERLQEGESDCNIIYHFTGNGGSECGHKFISGLLCEEIEDKYGWKEEDETGGLKAERHTMKSLQPKESGSKDDRSNEGGSKQDNRLNELFIKVASEQKPLLIVLDAINQIHDTDNAKLLNWLPVPPRNIRILFSTLEDDRTMEVFTRRNYEFFTLQPLTLGQRTSLVEGYLKLYGKNLTPEQISRIVREPQCENTLVLKTLLDELVKFGVYEKLDERIDYFLSADTIEDFYQTLLQSFEDDYSECGKDFVKHILSLIAVSRSGLSETELLEITDIKPLLWSQFYCAFMIHLVNKDGLISFSHKYVSDAVWKRYLTEPAEENSFREEIIALFTNPQLNHPTNRTWTELPFQYYHKNDLDLLYKILQDLKVFSYLYENHEMELVDYWRRLLDAAYDPKVYQDILKNSEEKPYGDIIYFFKDYFSLLDFSLLLSLDQVEYCETEYGKEHPSTARSYSYIGFAYDSLGNYDRGLEYYFKALKIQEEVLGMNHPSTAASYNNIGFIYDSLGNYDRGLEYYFKALKIWEDVLGENHPSTATSYSNVGGTYSSLFDYDKALEYELKALKIRKDILGENHPDTATSYDCIGSTYYSLGDYDKGEEYYFKALKIREDVLGVNHPSTAISYNHIGFTYYRLGDYDKALEYYFKDIKIKEEVLGMIHPSIATSYSYIGLTYNSLGDYDKALEYDLKALKIQEQVLGENHPDTVTLYGYIGCEYYSLGDYDKGDEYYFKYLDRHEMALKIRENDLGFNYPDTAS